jgi:hypothetical protein
LFFLFETIENKKTPKKFDAGAVFFFQISTSLYLDEGSKGKGIL